MKPVQDGPVCIIMQEAFGCAVENRFFQLQDDDCDPLDLLHQATIEVTKRKKKETPAAKKSGNQQGNRKESQKERKIQVVPITAAPDQKRAPKPTLQKVTQNENNGAEVKVDRTERRMAFREFRPNIEKIMDYSNDNFEKERQVRSWVANQRGGSRGRGRGGFPRNMESENQRGRREFDRHSGSDRAEEDPVSVEHVENAEPPLEASEEEQDFKVSEEGSEDLQEMSLDEWKSMMDQSRPKADFNLRKPESSMPSKAVVIHKSKFADNMKHDEDYQVGFRKPVNDITCQLDINFGNLPRPGRGGRGGGRGRVRREEAFTLENLNVNDFALNPEDPDHFPALC
ncbi:intracellular hyaluronan-binding protein 4 isoform X2 [Aquarana catesbeiana]|uniref:intracellular hyaluronan-binding protein 4 isoform X2 n=1 Tax=Aquarana catesbeiana TaxID=8400 RepID=UPI003CC97DB6